MTDKKRPNILFIMTDDHAVQAISACGSVVNKTPNMDRIAAEGAVFDNSFCCNSLCAPSRASILTGKHSHINGQFNLGEKFDGSQMTLPKVMQVGGYSTAIFGKWHLNSDPTGFDKWVVLPGQGNYYSPKFLTPDGDFKVDGGYSTDVIADMTMKWLDEERDMDKPFITFCHFKAPHRPWMPAQRFLTLYDDVEMPEPSNLFDNYANRCDLLKENKMQISKDFRWNYDLKVHDAGPNADYFTMEKRKNDEWTEFARMSPEQRAAWDAAYEPKNEKLRERRLEPDEMTSWAYQRYVKDYLRCIAAVDENVGRLLDYLDSAGLTEDTIVIYCSDQGFYLGEHGWYDKRWMFEESLRMPLLVRWPGVIKPGTRYEQMVQNIDYLPTLLEAAGIAIPEGVQGESIMRVIDDGEKIHDDIYYHYYSHGGHGVPKHDGVRTERYKLIHFYTADEFNLFDLKSDKSEMVSVHGDPAYADVLADMMARYERARADYAALPLNSEPKR